MSAVYDDLGVSTVINAAGTLTRLGGSRMPPEVLAAMAAASQSFVRIEDLQVAAGRVIAAATGAEDGYVTAGAAAGLLLGTAACVAGLDPAAMDRLPDTRGLKNEVVVQRVHRNSYDHAVRTVGIRLVEVGGLGHPTPRPTEPWELAAAITRRTACVLWPVMAAPDALPLTTVTQIAHDHDVPVLVDAAAALPPPENLRRFITEGADLVTFSGGKALRGPQASGILAGRADLIRSVALQHQDMDVLPETWTWRHLLEQGVVAGPPGQGIGRVAKVGREEVVGLVTALQRYLALDHDAERQRLVARARRLASDLAGLRHITVTALDGPEERFPSVRLDLDELRLGITAIAAVNALAGGDPIIAVGQGMAPQGSLLLNPFNLDTADEMTTVVRRLREVLTPP